MQDVQKPDDAEGAVTPPAAIADAPSPERRGALKKLGRFAAYTAPAMIALLASDRAARAC